MKNHIFLTVVSVAVLTGITFAQPGPGRESGGPGSIPQGTLSGRVFDADLNVPIEYANVVLYSLRDSSQVTGGITGPDGRFRLTGLRPGRFYLEVSFIGYKSRVIADVQLAPGAKVDMGLITLQQAVVAVQGVEAVAERPKLEYRIDKKVLDVGRQATAASGTAVDVLENAPSVKVDIEGNVSLRGSQNFTVLVDGRPTVFEPSEALQQIPASTIDKVEIITNPSAKYDPEGVSGIINVILKKQKRSGLNGIVNANGGWGGQYGGDFLFSYRHGIATSFIGANYNRRSFPGTRETERWTRYGDTTSYINASGDSKWNPRFEGLRAGTDLQFTERDRTSVAGRYGSRNMNNSTTGAYEEWTEPGADTTSHGSTNSSVHGGGFFSLDLDHQHRFSLVNNGREQHQLLGRLGYRYRGGDDETKTELTDSAKVPTSGWRTVESGPGGSFDARLDYTLPFGEKGKFEAGYGARMASSEEQNKAYEYNPAADSYEFRDEYSHTSRYTDAIHSLYSTGSAELGKFGFQAGLRGEYQGRAIELVGELEPFALDRWDYFPTLHLSYRLPAEAQLMASYTRRIDRPRGWSLTPFLTWVDAYNVRQGNPDLKPEYISSYEAGFLKPFGANRVSVDAYYRVTTNKTEHVQSVYRENVILHTSANVGTDHALGVEGMLDLNPFKWWTVNLSGDVYDYRVVLGRDSSNKSFNWGGRLENEFRLPTNTRLQLNVRYRSPSASAQGTQAARFTTDVAVRQQFLNRQLSVTLQARDILGTGGHESTSGGENFHSYMNFRRGSPVLMLNVQWNFNNYRPERRQRATGEEELEPIDGMQ